MYSASSYNMHKNRQDAQKIRVIRLYFPLDALHVSDYISTFSGANFIGCTSYLVNAETSGCLKPFLTVKPLTETVKHSSYGIGFILQVI